jgi:predicted glutamate--cysteine ligase
MFLLPKGFEVEMYTGTTSGEIVGLSEQIVHDLPQYMREPDARNVEYATPPLADYDALLCELVRPRLVLRDWLTAHGEYTLLPGSTLALAGSDRFVRSDPTSPYHDRIEALYGTRVATCSIHINFGISDPDDILKACRLLRLEAPLVLALSASSPFFDGQVTGAHSTRWLRFPRTPEQVPLFADHAHYVSWVEEQLRLGTMYNVRHLWSSVRPNGPDRPYGINRAELRIADMIASPLALLGITVLIEHRLIGLMAGDIPDPLASRFSTDELVAIADHNERAAATASLDAELIDWQSGERLTARAWVARLLTEAEPFAAAHGLTCYLKPVARLLEEGNEAMRWLERHRLGVPVREVLLDAAARMADEEQELLARLCAGTPA